MTLRGEAVAFVPGVAPQEVFDFVLDPAQYTKADTKIVWVTKLADTDDGMLAREDGRWRVCRRRETLDDLLAGDIDVALAGATAPAGSQEGPT